MWIICLLMVTMNIAIKGKVTRHNSHERFDKANYTLGTNGKDFLGPFIISQAKYMEKVYYVTTHHFQI